jgi:hypothetical protein|nr:MAG TPA: hypothetical protein [Caudoviricetes sp.]
MKFIEKILMASEDVKSYLVSGVCKDKELADGSLVEIGDLIDHEVYKGLKDMNTREIKPYAGTGRVGIVDYVGVSGGEIMNVWYSEGVKTCGLPVPAGKATRVRTLKLGDEFYLGEGNFGSAPTVGQFAVAGTDGMWAPAADAATDKLCVKIEFNKDKIIGVKNEGKKYFCTVVHE